MSDQVLTSSGMYRDVMQQPDCWQRLIGRDLGDWQQATRSTQTGLLVGMGSSHYAGLAAQFALARSGGIWNCATSDQALHYLPPGQPYDRIVAISQSGE